MKSVEAILKESLKPEDLEDLMFPAPGIGVAAMKHCVDLVDFGERLGLETVSHDSGGKMVWDIRPQPDGASTARSHSSSEFTWHTDASFEETPPRYFALQVIHGDRYGGGTQEFVGVGDVLSGLDTGTLAQLEDTEFVWSVPEEFRKGIPSQELPIIFRDESGKPALRFRAECITRSALTGKQGKAVQRLERSIASTPSLTHVPESGQVVLVDNWHVLHRRDAVRDPHRHLQRVRYR